MESTEENFYNLELNQIYQKLQTDPDNGLTQKEASNRLLEFGLNEIPKVSKGFIKIYLAPLFNWLIVIYLIGALILFLAWAFGGEGNLLFISLTLGIVFINCLVAIIQQYRATKKLKALRELTAPTSTIIRDGQKMEVPTKDIVKGDLLSLEQGDKVPADARIVQCFNLEVNEASLTGESEPVRKTESGNALKIEDISIGERNNMVFYGTYITTGTGKSIVVKIGGDTEIGKISHGLEEAGTSEIPIREKMNNFGKWLGLAVFVFWFISLMVIWIASGFTRLEVVESLNSALDLLPINIPLLVTIVLITGVLAMAHHGVIIRNLASVDSLGRVSVVCSDKTGTLTKNQMSVQHIWTNGSVFRVTGSGYSPEGDIVSMDDPKNPTFIKHIDEYPSLKLLLTSGFLNNNSALVKNELQISGKTHYNWEVIGSSTEGALMVLFQKGMGDYLLDEFESITEYPFDSSVKRMTKLYKRDHIYVSFTKGASEVLLPLCKKIIYQDKEIELNPDINDKVMEIVNLYANQGYRILSLCYKEMNEIPPDGEEGRKVSESDLTFIGFVTILDPPREGVRDSVEQCREAGVDVVMITGDSPATARAIALQISIVTNESDIVAEGKDVNNIESYEEFSKIKVFARVSPEHKEDIVEKYQEQKKVVAMTGDGVNDALALNMADAGIAMGIAGTDVAKEASDMVISDDSFNSIVTGIHHGRGIFARIRTVVFFYICINIFEGIIQFLLAIILDLPYFLDEAFYYQWIFLSITLHMFPGLILTFDSTSEDVMKEKPRDSEEILSKNIIVLLFIFGLLLAISMVVVYWMTISGLYPVFPENIDLGSWNSSYLYTSDTFLNPDLNPFGVGLTEAKTLTMLMVTLFFCESFLIFQIRRPNKSLFRSLIEDSNKRMYLIIGFLFALFIMLMYIPGVQVTLAKAGINFMFMYLTGIDWLMCFLISLICIVSFEIVKYISRSYGITY
ncbi:MAG: cation-transporting P-type ATPase [Candidatus Lokiarchaeota archaeon]|nr:cation-transporting P-type ATPase [Candidatus Lokiarchaeota archaeon]